MPEYPPATQHTLTSQPAPGRRPRGALGSQGCTVCKCCHLLACLSLVLQMRLLQLPELPGTSNASSQVYLFVIYTIVPRTPSVTLNLPSDVIENF